MSAPSKLEANHNGGSPPNVRELLNYSEAMKQGDQRTISHAECHDEVYHQIGAQTANRRTTAGMAETLPSPHSNSIGGDNNCTSKKQQHNYSEEYRKTYNAYHCCMT